MSTPDQPISRSDSELPYGLGEDGRMVAVDRVARGLACNCRCPQCDRRLIARQGEVLAWHFAHEAADAHCAGAFETMTHRLAKQVIADAGVIRIPALIGCFEGYTYRIIEEARDVTLTDVRLEVWLDGIRPDIIARLDDGTDLAVEVFVSHRSDEEKISIFRERQLAAIEIDLSQFRNSPVTGDIFSESVLRGTWRVWLWNPRQAEADAMVAAEQKERRAKARAAAAVVEAARHEAEAQEKAAALAYEEAQRKFYAAGQQRMAAERERLAGGDCRAKQAAELATLRASAALESEQRIAFLRSLPTAPVETELTPSCKCRTLFMWRDSQRPSWRCFTCDASLEQSAVEIIRAEISGLKPETIAA